MSNQSEAKVRQGYKPLPVHHTCANCENSFRKTDPYPSKASRFCRIGAFKVNATATCNLWEMDHLI